MITMFSHLIAPRRSAIKRGMPRSRSEQQQRDLVDLVKGIAVVALMLIGFAVAGGEDMRGAIAAQGPQVTVAEAVNRVAAERETRAAVQGTALTSCEPLERRKAHTAERVSRQCVDAGAH